MIKDNYVYYDANFDRIFLTDKYHHDTYETWLYSTYGIYWIGML